MIISKHSYKSSHSMQIYNTMHTLYATVVNSGSAFLNLLVLMNSKIAALVAMIIDIRIVNESELLQCQIISKVNTSNESTMLIIAP